MLDNIVASSDFLDNCRPDHITTRRQDTALEFDRQYAEVCLRVSGNSTRKPTSLPKRRGSLQTHRHGDLNQLGPVNRSLEITEADLRIDRMITKIPERLPLLRIDRTAKYIRYLDQIGYSYISSCRRARKQNA